MENVKMTIKKLSTVCQYSLTDKNPKHIDGFDKNVGVIENVKRHDGKANYVSVFEPSLIGSLSFGNNNILAIGR